MANINDIIRKYKGGQTAPGSSLGQAPGAIRRDVGLEAAEARKQQTLQAGAAQEVQAQQMEQEESAMQGLQRRSQTQRLQMSGIEDKRMFEIQSNQIVNNLQNNLKQLSNAEKLDRLEAASAYTRLMNDKYRYELEDEGRRRRLSDGLKFDAALKEAIFSDEISLLRDNIAFNKALDLDEAAFEKYLATIDVETALAVATSEAKAASETAMISGIGSAATRAYSAYTREEG